MPDAFQYNVFLSHSSKDKSVVRAVAERLRKNGLRVWFEDWVLKPGDSIPAKIDEGLEQSRVLACLAVASQRRRMLCMSANAFGSDWAQLESGTFRFRDALNKERRFIPLRLDDAPIKGSLAQFLYINWRVGDREQEYAKLLAACQPPTKPARSEGEVAREHATETTVQLDYRDTAIWAYAFSPDGKHALTRSMDRSMRLWDVETGRCLRLLC